MALDNQQRRQLRQEMVGAFNRPALDLFLQDWLDIELERVVPPGNIFDMDCQLVIAWAERNGRLTALLQAFQNNHPKQTFASFAAGLLARLSTTVTAPYATNRPFFINTRPVLNRKHFWERLSKLANGAPGGRVLAVNGGVGKSYSRWPISHICDPSRNHARMVRVEANSGQTLDVTGVSLATAIASRMWGDNGLEGGDELAQVSRITKDLAATLIARLAALPDRTWLVIDELDLVNLDKSAVEFLCKLCEAVDGNECPNLWLFLLGLEPTKLSAHVAPYIPLDVVHRPERTDIEEFVRWFARTAGRPDDPLVLKPSIDALDALLPPEPNHDHWKQFHSQLHDTCERFRQGTLP